MSLQGDGINDEFYFLLWAKDELKYGPSINIPDTIIYKFGQPVAWYFTSTDGSLKRKNKHNLVNVHIEESFTKYVLAGDAVAYYISLPTTGFDDDADAVTRIEYFDRQGLHDFLHNRWKESNGVLQRFIEPKGLNNSMIRAIWSPKVCLVERRENVRQLVDRRFGLYERAVTYEGEDYCSRAAPLRGNILISQIQTLCQEIVDHVAEVTFQKQRIARFVLNFKVDARDKLYLLWTSSIRLEDTDHCKPRRAWLSSHKPHDNVKSQAKFKSLNIDAQLKLPKYVRLEDKANHTVEQPRPVQHIDCISCGLKKAIDCFYDLAYKALIMHYDSLLTLLCTSSLLSCPTASAFRANRAMKWPPDPQILAAAGSVGFGPFELGGDEAHDKRRKLFKGRQALVPMETVMIPPILQYLHPKLTPVAYLRYKKDPLFLFKNTLVCEDCYLVYAEFANATFNAVGGPLSWSFSLAMQTPQLTALFGRRQAPPRGRYDEICPLASERRIAPGRLAAPSHILAVICTAKVPSSRSARTRRLARPLSEKPVSSVEEQEFLNAADAAISKAGAPVPRVPASIHNVQEARSQYKLIMDRLMQLPYSRQDGHVCQVGQLPSGSIEDIVCARENAFFKEHYTDPQVPGYHPLEHLITSHKRIADWYVPKFRKDGKKEKKKYAPYAQNLTYVAPRSSKAASAQYSTQSSTSSVPTSTFIQAQLAQEPSKATTQVTKAADASAGPKRERQPSFHQEYLIRTLTEVQSQLNTPGALIRSILQSLHDPPADKQTHLAQVETPVGTRPLPLSSTFGKLGSVAGSPVSPLSPRSSSSSAGKASGKLTTITKSRIIVAAAQNQQHGRQGVNAVLPGSVASRSGSKPVICESSNSCSSNPRLHSSQIPSDSPSIRNQTLDKSIERPAGAAKSLTGVLPSPTMPPSPGRAPRRYIVPRNSEKASELSEDELYGAMFAQSEEADKRRASRGSASIVPDPLSVLPSQSPKIRPEPILAHTSLWNEEFSSVRDVEQLQSRFSTPVASPCTSSCPYTLPRTVGTDLEDHVAALLDNVAKPQSSITAVDGHLRPTSIASDSTRQQSLHSGLTDDAQLRLIPAMVPMILGTTPSCSSNAHQPPSSPFPDGSIPAVPLPIRLHVNFSPTSGAESTNLPDTLSTQRFPTAKVTGPRGNLSSALRPPDTPPLIFTVVKSSVSHVKPEDWYFHADQTSALSGEERQDRPEAVQVVKVEESNRESEEPPQGPKALSNAMSHPHCMSPSLTLSAGVDVAYEDETSGGELLQELSFLPDADGILHSSEDAVSQREGLLDVLEEAACGREKAMSSPNKAPS